MDENGTEASQDGDEGAGGVRGIDDPGSDEFGYLSDPNFEIQDPDEIYRTNARPLDGLPPVSTLEGGAPPPPRFTSPGAKPESPIPLPSVPEAERPAGGSVFGPRGAMIFDQNGKRLTEDPTLHGDMDEFCMDEPTGSVQTALPDLETEAIEEPETVEPSEELEDLAGAARRLLATPGAGGDEPPSEIEQLQAELERHLLRAMVLRLNEPDWYLTGVEVGLQSLHRLYESSRMVYANCRHRSAGVAKVQNLRVVYEQLLSFRGADSGKERGLILIAHRRQFEDLLGDIQDGRRSRGLASQNFTLYEQVAKDLTEAVNRQRSYQNLIRAVEGVAKLPKMMHRLREKKVAALLTGYEQILVGLEWEDPAGFQTKGQLTHKASQLRERIRRERRHLAQVRDELYKDKPHAIDHPDAPELDLDSRKVIPFLRRTSKHGLDYLSRAFSVYEHALEGSKGARRVLARIEKLELAAEPQAGDAMVG